MKEKRRRRSCFAVVLVIVLAMFLTLLPEAKEVKAASANLFVKRRTNDITSADFGKTIYSYSFKADSSKYLDIAWQYVQESGYAWGADPIIRLVDSGNNVIDPYSGGGLKSIQWRFTKADTYTFKVMSNYNGSGKQAYYFTGVLTDMPDEAASGSFKDYEVTYDKLIEGVRVSYSSYSGSAAYEDAYWLRQDQSDQTVKCLGRESSHIHSMSDTDILPDKTYTYYVIKVADVDAELENAIPTERGQSVKMSAVMLEKLRKMSASADVTTPAPDIPDVVNVKVGAGVASANLNWGMAYNENGKSTGYQLQQYYGDKLTHAYKVGYKYTTQVSKTLKIPYAGTSKIRIRVYYTHPNGKTYYGAWSPFYSFTSKKLSPSTGSVTKISSKKARITIGKVKGATGTIIYQKVGKSWKKLGTTTKTAYTVSKNTAGKRKYRLKSYIKDNGKTYYSTSYSKTYSPQANVIKCSYPGYAGGYSPYGHYWRPVKFYYSGNKLKVDGKFINTHLYRLDYCYIKLTVKCQGKVIGTKTINSGKMASNQVKKINVTMDKSKAGYDLRAGKLSWSYKVLKYK